MARAWPQRAFAKHQGQLSPCSSSWLVEQIKDTLVSILLATARRQSSGT
jgi:hypothetical protein